MSSRNWATAAAVVLGLAGSMVMGVSAQAADLSEAYPGSGTPYDDPRYGDIYRHPLPPRYATPAPQPYAPQAYPPPEYREEYRENYREQRGYLRDMNPPPAHYGSACLPKHVIRDNLERRGWQDFQDLEAHGNVVQVRARRPSGRAFDLSVDRCSGQVLEARPVERRAAHADQWRYQPGPPGY